MVDTPWTHTTVLLNEAIEALVTTADGHYVDATFGRGGHSRLLLSKLGPTGRVTAFDKDTEAQHAAQSISDPRFSIRHEGFKELANFPQSCAQGILLDLGISSPQVDNAARGFSFRSDGPLDMRMDITRGQSVSDWLRDASEPQIEEVVRTYGEERFSKHIAKAIVLRQQERGPIVGTLELAGIVASAVKTREPGKDPATRTFQALRIFINAELQELELALEASLQVLATGGRLVVISFHSLEDRIVKQFITRHSREVVDRTAPDWMLVKPSLLSFTSLGRAKPSAAEVAANPRSRSAVMRVAERTEVRP